MPRNGVLKNKPLTWDRVASSSSWLMMAEVVLAKSDMFKSIIWRSREATLKYDFHATEILLPASVSWLALAEH